MPAHIRAVQPQQPLHVYRHLLREVSYLPPVCRTRIEPRLRSRFRRHANDPAPDKRLRQARHDLRNLKAANLGHMDRMRRVLMLTFGRIGWRRHELFADLRQAEQPDTSAQLADRLRETRLAEDWLDRWDTEKLLVFARSQASRSLRSSPRPRIASKRLDPAQAVPPMSIWGKPFGEKAARSKLRKWWKKFANRILPPIPRGEWDLLQRLSTGQAAAEWAVPARRNPAVSTTRPVARPTAQDEAKAWDWAASVTKPIRVIERPSSRRFRLPTGADRPPPGTLGEGVPIGLHHYTPRFWRRLYGELWQMTAVMERRAAGSGSRWAITWGGVPLQPLAPTVASREFFEGVDSKGNPLTAPAASRPTPRTREGKENAER